MSCWQHKVVLITGGSRGLGRALSEAFVQAGASIVPVARQPSALTDLAERLRQTDPAAQVLPVAADVTRDEDVQRMVAQVTESHGRLDVVVNCAGISSRGKAVDTTPAEFQALFDLNFLAVVRVTQAVLPLLRASRGSLVNVGSLASKTPGMYLGAYPATKYAVAAYSHQLRLELAADGVHVLLVCPGPILRSDAGQRYADQSRDLPASASRPGGGARLKGMLPEKLAAQIMRATGRRQPELVLPARARLMFAISQLSPRVGDWLIRKTSGG